MKQTSPRPCHQKVSWYRLPVADRRDKKATALPSRHQETVALPLFSIVFHLPHLCYSKTQPSRSQHVREYCPNQDREHETGQHLR
ncbi:hypothetical protein EV363DRAFT_1231490 [Boletus edulis]|nr:hypothetical protein EV363DRAFT_1231490 [Boletus edulis]